MLLGSAITMHLTPKVGTIQVLTKDVYYYYILCEPYAEVPSITQLG